VAVISCRLSEDPPEQNLSLLTPVGLPPLLCVVGGREPIEGGVGPVGIVLGAPVADEDLGFEEAGELLDVEQLVAHPAAVRPCG
jgi:hypothetical protein